MTFQELLIDYLTQLDCTAKELAAASGLSASVISRYRSGSHSPDPDGEQWQKLAAGIADTCVTFACKAHLRNGRPIVLAVSTNDGLAAAARNIGDLLNRKHYFFVPFGQDDPRKKPTSLIADLTKLPDTVDAALQGVQLQPLLL